MATVAMATVVAERACALCGLPCPDGSSPIRREAGLDRSFCCAGCMNVYAILLESGMVQEGVELRETELFRRSLELGLVSAGRAARRTEPRLTAGRPSEEMSLHVTGMWCGSCAWLIEQALCAEPGVVEAGVSFASDTATVRYCPMETAPERIRRRIESLGYAAADETPGDASAKRERTDSLLRLGIAAFLWLNVMTLNVAIYVGYFERLPGSVASWLPLLLMALSAPAVFYCAWPVLRLAWRGLANGVVRAETLLASGIVCAWLYSAVEAIRGGPHVYFDTACAIVVFVLLGKWIERSAKDKAKLAVTRLYRLMPSKARIVTGAGERFVTVEALREGDVFLVKAGERIPADGLVVEGQSHADESLLTGESAPVARRVGSTVVGGSLNLDGVLQVRTTRVGAESTLARIVKMVERALAARSSVERAADRVARLFVPVVALIALGTFAAWHWGWGGIGIEEAALRAVAVLVIACPCALGIAAPLAITAAVGAASRNGMLVSDSSVLETVERIDVLVLDKTGTVTDGEMTLVEAPDQDIQILASLERCSEHPLGRAVVGRARELGFELLPAEKVVIHRGRGMSGRVDGREVAIGTRPLVGPTNAQIERRAREFERTGMTVVFYGWNGFARGVLAFGNQLRPGAAELVSAVQRMGVRVSVVSGDSRAATEWAARSIGADELRSEVPPEEKARYIEELRRDGRTVAMVGDGINDAPALAAANLGIAMGCGADIAMNAAAVVLSSNSLPRVLDIFTLARRTLRVVRQNLFWAFAYNTAGITLAAWGLLHPIFAAAAMVASSLCVVLNSARLLRAHH